MPLEEIAPSVTGAGVGQRSIPGEAEALGFIYGAFDEIRKAARGLPKLHTFLSCANGTGGRSA